MATPTWAEVWTQIANGIHPLETMREAAANWLTQEDTYTQALEGNYLDQALAGLGRARANLSALLSPESAQAVITPHLRELGRIIGSQHANGNIQLLIDDIYQHMVDNDFDVNSKNFTHGAVSAGGSNVGNGTILRLNVDENNLELEAQYPNVKRFICVADQNSGAEKHEEVFEARSQDPARDNLDVFTRGRGGTARIAALSARNSLLLNPSFTSFSGTAALPTAITNWTSSTAVIGDGTDYTFDTTNFYRSDPSDGAASAALNIKLTRTLTQALSVRRTRLDPNVPYYMQVAYNRQVGSATGTLRIDMGAVNNSVAVSAQTGWNLLGIVATPSNNNWLKQFNQDTLTMDVNWTRTGGELLVDDVMFVPFTRFDGGWYLILGGATAFLVDDVFTFTDSESGAVINRWFHHGYGRQLRHINDGSETIADP